MGAEVHEIDGGGDRFLNDEGAYFIPYCYRHFFAINVGPDMMTWPWSSPSSALGVKQWYQSCGLVPPTSFHYVGPSLSLWPQRRGRTGESDGDRATPTARRCKGRRQSKCPATRLVPDLWIKVAPAWISTQPVAILKGRAAGHCP